ncbi:ArsR/SmtB family transcription factor [Streptomyces sp. NPDC054933]
MTATDPVLRALAHPLRLRMLSLMWTAPMSAAELARELDISHALASQHLRRLDAVGLTELVEIRPHRGGQERRYRTVHGTVLSDRREAEPLLAEALAVNLRERASRRAPDAEGVTADAELWVSPQAWQDFRRQLAELTAALHDSALAPHAPNAVRVGLTVTAFPLAD